MSSVLDHELSALKLPPHSVEAEQSVLGGLLLENSAWDRIGDVVSESDFYRQDHRQILRAIVRQIAENRPADSVTVAEALQSMGQLEGVGEGWRISWHWRATRRRPPTFAAMPKSCANARCCAGWPKWRRGLPTPPTRRPAAALRSCSTRLKPRCSRLPSPAAGGRQASSKSSRF